MSCAAGKAGRNARKAISESPQLISTLSPRVSTLLTPGSAAIASRSASGKVARMVLSPTVALISVAGPSATTCPFAIRMIRSAYASASSR
jgi:hypothetical protein